MNLHQYLIDHPDAEAQVVQRLLNVSPADYLWVMSTAYPERCAWRLNVGRKKMAQVLETYKAGHGLNDTALKHRDVSRADIRAMVTQAGLLRPLVSRRPPAAQVAELHQRIRELAATGLSRRRIRLALKTSTRVVVAVLGASRPAPVRRQSSGPRLTTRTGLQLWHGTLLKMFRTNPLTTARSIMQTCGCRQASAYDWRQQLRDELGITAKPPHPSRCRKDQRSTVGVSQSPK